MKKIVLLIFIFHALVLIANCNDFVYWDSLPNNIKSDIVKKVAKNKRIKAFYDAQAYNNCNSDFIDVYSDLLKLVNSNKKPYLKAFYFDMLTKTVKNFIADSLFCNVGYDYLQYVINNPEYCLNYYKQMDNDDVIICNLARYCLPSSWYNDNYLRFADAIKKKCNNDRSSVIQEYSNSFIRRIDVRRMQLDSVMQVMEKEKAGRIFKLKSGKTVVILYLKNIYARMPIESKKQD